MPEGIQLRLEPCIYCRTCPASYFCDEGATEFGCDNEFTPPRRGQAGGRDVMHPLRPDLTERLWECGGLDIQIRTRATKRPVPALPPYIPRVQVRPGFSAERYSAMAVPLDRVRPSAPVRTAAEMKADLGLPSEAVLIVSSFQDDAVLETAWRHRRSLIDSLASAGYDLATVPSFSLWGGDTRLEHRYNIARSLRMFEMLTEAGVPTIPHVSWYLRRDVDDWVKELRGWPGFPAFSLDLATLETEPDWAWLIHGLRRLMDGIGKGWEVLVNGVALRRRIREVADICGHIHLTNERPFQLAMCQYETLDELVTSRTRPTPKARADVFAAEVQKMFDAIPEPPPTCRLSVPLSARA